MEFYSTRRKYYDRFGYSDIILGLVKLYQKTPEKIPEYAQVVVDEFQDFNKLEVALIEQLSRKSPILIVGDDDQAIYEFKRSSPEFIRALHGDGRPEFEPFPLPFCSRSTRVIVEAINDIIAVAIKNGFLILLCHIFLRGDGPVIGALQHGHRGRLLTSAPISRRRMVAIEFGM